MKNIHILPTDKPSRLIFNSFHKSFCYQKEIDGMYINDGKVSGADFWGLQKALNNGFKPQNIYIISDEEIKEGDWVITPTNDIIQWAKVFQPIGKKIILTTDQYLIRNSVQAITDEFIEWFVKNPKSENVYVYKKYKQVNQNNPVTRGSTALGFSHYEVQSLDLSAPIGTSEKEIDILELGQIIPKEEYKKTNN